MCVKKFSYGFFFARKIELLTFEHVEVVGAWKCGVKVIDISSKLGHSERTVRSIIAKYKIKGDIVNEPRSGRPKALSERGVRTLNRIVRSKR